MPIGYGQEQNLVNLGDTAEIVAAITDVDDQILAPESLASVSVTVQKPDETQIVVSAEVRDDGTGYAQFDETDLVGEYIVVATFTTVDGVVRSSRIDFEVKDPFGEGTTPTDEIVDQVWLRLEDCFDSQEGGPWLRDQTLRFFNKDKIAHFVGDAMLHINVQPPMTNATIETFTTPSPNGDPDHDRPILVQAVLISVIHHLIRSYTEVYEPQGANVPYLSRVNYQQRWMAVLQIEEPKFKLWLAHWKRQFLGLGHSSLLVGSKAGRLYYPGMRTRTVGRGWL